MLSRRAPRLAAVLGLVLAIGMVAPAAGADPAFVVIASGFHSPRGLTLAPNGRLYVGEAGLAGGTPATGTQPGFGFSSSISVIRHPLWNHPTVRTLVAGLPSAGDTEGVIGVDGVSAARNGSIYAIIGLSNEGTGLPGALGRLIRVEPDGDKERVGNVGRYDYGWTSRHASLSPRDFPDANPYGVLATGGRVFVVDAGANTLDEVRDGRTRVLAFFPDNALADSTPTCVTKGPDGALYIGTLAFADFFANGPSSIVYRVDLADTKPSSLNRVLHVATVWATGLAPITGCAFGPHGNFYASEFIAGFGATGPFGEVVRIPFAHPDVHVALTGGTLSFPGGIAVDRHGHVFVVNKSTDDNGEVVLLK